MRSMKPVLLSAMLLAWPGPRAEGAAGSAPHITEYVILVTTDGLRWQEVFRGAEAGLMDKEHGGVAHVAELKQEFWRDDLEERRKALLPFLWTTIARRGQIYGNVDRESVARVTNGRNFSYPGYNELLTGAADPRIDSNAKRPNPNQNVLEWLNTRPGFRAKVAAFTTWDVFPYILNRERSGLYIVAGGEPIPGPDLTERQRLINELNQDTHRAWIDSCFDAFTFHAALEHYRRQPPRVLYVALGETDEFAHEGRYDFYLRSAHRVDDFLKRLWDEAQSHTQTRGKTTLIVSTDHGRGDGPTDWRNHGEKVRGADKIWIAVLGPDTQALGERAGIEPVTQGQVAATVAALLGEHYVSTAPRAAPPLAEALQRPQ